MAVAHPSRLAKNITEDYLTCSICLNRFREPKSLPCEHSFCLQCLAEHIKDTQINGTFMCPMDRLEIQIPENTHDSWECASSFESDTLLSELIHALSENVRKSTTIIHKETEEQLEFFCFGCNEIVSAENAVEKHRKSTCDCVNLKKAFKRVLPKISNLTKSIEGMIVKTNKLKAESRQRSESSSNNETLEEIKSFESKLERFYSRCQADILSLKKELLNSDEPGADDKLENLSRVVQSKYQSFNNAMDEENTVVVLEQYIDINNSLPGLQKQIDEIPKTFFRRNSSKFVPNESLLSVFDNPINCGHIHTIELSNFKAKSELPFNYYDVAITGKYLIVVDGENGLLKRYLSDCTFVDSLRLSNACRVTVLSDDDIAVTRFGKKKITLVTVGRKMYVKGHIRTKRSYIGIAWLNDGGYAVSYYDGESPPGIEILGKDGKVHRTVLGHPNPNGNTPLFVCPMFMTTTTSGDIVLCDYSETKNILCFTQHLELLWCHSLTSMPCSASCDRYSLYVTLPEENEVVALYQENGEKMRTIIKQTDGLERPYAISWYAGVLAVTEDESENIHLIHL